MAWPRLHHLALLVLIALAICLETPGAPIFAHWRVGRSGRPFPCLKFRTMAGEETDWAAGFAAIHTDGLLVLHRGRLTGEFTRADAAEEPILACAMGQATHFFT